MTNTPSVARSSQVFTWLLLALLTGALWVKGVAWAGTASESGLRVIMEPLRSSYAVGEAIRFRVHGNQRFFLYVYTVDDETGEAILLLPNKKEQDNKYEPGQTFTIPHPSIEFYSDSPGEEHVIMVASRKHIDLNSARFRDMGDFSATTTKDLEKAFAAKGIYLQEEDGSRRQDVVVTDLKLPIHKDSEPEAANAPRAVTFVSTDKTRYREGERVKIVFGADRPGWVHLYIVEPGGTYTLLTRLAVDGKTLNELTARAKSPTGPHVLLAAYSEAKHLDEALLNDIAAQTDLTKGLSPIGEQGVVAVRRFEVER